MSDHSPMRVLRDGAGLTQVQVAGFLKRAQANVSQWEGGGNRPNPDMIAALAKLYGVDVPTVEVAVEQTIERFLEGIDDRVAQAIEDTRAQLDLTQTALASAVGVTTGAVGFWESGVNRPSVDLVVQIAALTGRTAKRFLQDAGYDANEVATFLDTGVPPNPLAQLLSAGREAARLTQNQVASALGISQNNVSAIETGVHLPSDEALTEMQRLYGLVDAQVAAARHGAEVAVGRIPKPTMPLPLVPAHLTRATFVEEVRAHRSLRRKDLAAELGIDPDDVRHLENGGRTSFPDAATNPAVLTRLAELGGTTVDAMLAAFEPDVPGYLALVEEPDLVATARTVADLFMLLRFRGWKLQEIGDVAGRTREWARLVSIGRTTPPKKTCRGLVDLVPGSTEDQFDALWHRTKHPPTDADVVAPVDPTPAERIFSKIDEHGA